MVKKIRKFKPLELLIFKFLKLLRVLNVGLTSASNLSRLEEAAQDRSKFDLEFVKSIGQDHYAPLLSLLVESQSQLRQDLLVLARTNYKRGGYFVEFGATDGIKNSNTFLLENKFGWIGILVEPSPIWESNLRANRPNVIVSTKCVWKESGQLIDFIETHDPQRSKISLYDRKRHSGLSRVNNRYQKETISLEDLLIQNNAPAFIDYLSIDTEGSEFEILRAFDFTKFSFGLISVEHNYRENRQEIHKLLTSAGYVRIFSEISLWDYWYVKQ